MIVEKKKCIQRIHSHIAEACRRNKGKKRREKKECRH